MASGASRIVHANQALSGRVWCIAYPIAVLLAPNPLSNVGLLLHAELSRTKEDKTSLEWQWKIPRTPNGCPLRDAHSLIEEGANEI